MLSRFTWPVLIAGVHMPQGDPGRKSAMELMGEFRLEQLESPY